MPSPSTGTPQHPDLNALARLLAEAHRDPALTVAAGRFASLTTEEAMAVQDLTLAELGEEIPVTKVAINAAGRAVAAPIYATLAGPSGLVLPQPARGIAGIEVEIAVRLARTVTPELAAGPARDLLSAIESFHVGIEIIGTRFDDRAAAGANGPLADNLITAGYVWSPALWTRGPDISDIDIAVEIDGNIAWSGKGVHPFGGVLEPILAYGRAPLDGYGALAKGRIVTTGTLCGLVEIDRPALIRATISGAPPVELRLE